MAIISMEDLTKRVSEYIGDSADDAALSLLEDVSDTVADYSARYSQSEDWKSKYDALDEEWRAKYKARFTEGVSRETSPEATGPDPDPSPESPKTYDDLFKEVK